MTDKTQDPKTTVLDNPAPKNTYQTGWRIIGVSGDTIDGREISAQTLEQIAQDYDPKVYGARINIEHNSYWWGDTGGLGDVVALKTEAWQQDQSKTALLAQMTVFPEMQSLWDEGRKIYTSMEILPNFANTKRPYLVGLAITDSPASLGTTANFTAAQTHAKAKTQSISAYRPLTANTPQADQMTGQAAAGQDTPLPEKFTAMQQEHGNIKARLEQLQADFDALKDKLEKEPYTGQRPPHQGSDTAARPQVW